MRTGPIIYILVVAFLLNTIGPLPIGQADEFRLPMPGVMVHLSPPLDPPILKGIKVYPENPFHFGFILDKGDSELSTNQLKDESSKLIKYFLASLTIPEKDLWVNLSPYEKDRIIPNSFGLTEMGRDLLAEDYMLKQITASLIYPEDDIGKKFWKRIYQEAQKKFGTTDIPVNTFNKVWILPEKAVVYENLKAGTAYVVESKLKVMLAQDYLSLQKHSDTYSQPQARNFTKAKELGLLGADIVREIVIPQLTIEVNQNKNFSRLRQVYNSLILAAWYKKKIKDSIFSYVYSDKYKVAGVNVDDPQEKEKIYQRYLMAFKKGVYNYIKDDIDPITQTIVPRKYFSGGALLYKVDSAMTILDHIDAAQLGQTDGLEFISSRIDAAMTNKAEALANFTTDHTKELRFRASTVIRTLAEKVNAKKLFPFLEVLSHYGSPGVGKEYMSYENFIQQGQWSMWLSRYADKLERGGWRLDLLKGKEFLELDAKAEILVFVHPELKGNEFVQVIGNYIVIFASNENTLKNLYKQVDFVLKESEKEKPEKMKAHVRMQEFFDNIQKANVLTDPVEKLRAQQKEISILEGAYLAGAEGGDVREYLKMGRIQLTEPLEMIYPRFLLNGKKESRKIIGKSADTTPEDLLREAYRRVKVASQNSVTLILRDSPNVDYLQKQILDGFLLPDGRQLKDMVMEGDVANARDIGKFDAREPLQVKVIRMQNRVRICFLQTNVHFAGEETILRQWDIRDKRLTVLPDTAAVNDRSINQKIAEALSDVDDGFHTVDLTASSEIDWENHTLDHLRIDGHSGLNEFKLSDDDLIFLPGQKVDRLEMEIKRVSNGIIFYIVGYVKQGEKFVPLRDIPTFFYEGRDQLRRIQNITYDRLVDFKLHTAFQSKPTESMTIDLTHYGGVDLVRMAATDKFLINEGQRWGDQDLGFNQKGFDELKVTVSWRDSIVRIFKFRGTKYGPQGKIQEEVEWGRYHDKMEYLNGYYRPDITNPLKKAYATREAVTVNVSTQQVRNNEMKSVIGDGFPLPDGTLMKDPVALNTRSQILRAQTITAVPKDNGWEYTVVSQASYTVNGKPVEDTSTLLFENGQLRLIGTTHQTASSGEIESQLAKITDIKEGETYEVDISEYRELNWDGPDLIRPGFKIDPDIVWSPGSDNISVRTGKDFQGENKTAIALFQRYEGRMFAIITIGGYDVRCFVYNDGRWVHSRTPSSLAELKKQKEKEESIKQSIRVIQAAYAKGIGEATTIDLTKNPAISRRKQEFVQGLFPTLTVPFNMPMGLRLSGGFRKVVRIEGKFVRVSDKSVELRLLATVEDHSGKVHPLDIVPVFEIGPASVIFRGWEGKTGERQSIIDKVRLFLDNSDEKSMEIADVSLLIGADELYMPGTDLHRLQPKMDQQNTRTSLTLQRTSPAKPADSDMTLVFNGYQQIDGQEVLVDTLTYEHFMGDTGKFFIRKDYLHHRKEQKAEELRKKIEAAEAQRTQQVRLETAVDVQLQGFLNNIDKEDILPLLSRYSLDIRNILWGVLGVQLKDKFDPEKVNQIISEKIWKIIQDQTERTSGAMADLTPFEAKNGEEDTAAMKDGIRKLAGYLQKIVAAIPAPDQQAAEMKKAAERQAVLFIKKLEEIYFFKTFYRELPGEDMELQAKAAVEAARKAESLPIIQQALDLLLAEIEEAIKISNQLQQRGLKGLNLYQLIAVMRFIKDKRKLLADEMGLGKTLETLASFLMSDAREMVVIGPNQVLGRWLDDIADHLHTDLEVVVLAPDVSVESLKKNPHVTVTRITDRDERYTYMYSRTPPAAGKRRIIIQNYEALPRYERFRKDHNLPQLRTDFLALDEVHFLKKEDNVTTEAVFGSEEKHVEPMAAEYRMLISGTPLENEAADLFVYLKYLSEGGQSWEQKFFAGMSRRKFNSFFEVKDMEKMALLHNYLSELMIRRLKDDVVKGLPQKQYGVARLDPLARTLRLGDRVIQLEGDFQEQLALYEHAIRDPDGFELKYARGRKAREDDGEEDEEVTAGASTQLLRMEQAAVDPQVFGLKIDNIAFSAVREILRGYRDQGKNVLVFAEQSTYLEDLRQYLGDEFSSKLGYMDGDIPKEIRQEEVNKFQNGENNVFLLSIGTGGVGINLTNADAVIFLDHPWKPSRLQQAIDRAHRRDAARNKPGKKLDIITMEWDVPVSIGHLKAKLNMRKQIIINMITNGLLDPVLLDAYENLEGSLIEKIEKAKDQNDVGFDTYEQKLATEFYQKLSEILRRMKEGEDVRQLWDEVAPIYAAILEHKSSFIAARASLQVFSSAAFPDLKRPANHPMQVIDLFSGTSVLKRAYMKDEEQYRQQGLNLSIMDVDWSLRMLQAGVQEGGQVQLSVDQLNKLHADSADWINLSYGFRLAQHPAQMMKDIHRILRANGRFVLILPPNNELPVPFINALNKIGFTVDDRQLADGKRGVLRSKMDDGTYRQLVAEFGQEFADDLANYVNREFTILIANKTKQGSEQAVSDDEFTIKYQRPNVDIEKIQKLGGHKGRIRLVPQIVKIEGGLEWVDQKPGAAETEGNPQDDYYYHTFKNSLRKLSTYILKLNAGDAENRAVSKTAKWNNRANDIFQTVVDGFEGVVSKMQEPAAADLLKEFHKFHDQPYVPVWLREHDREEAYQHVLGILNEALEHGPENDSTSKAMMSRERKFVTFLNVLQEETSKDLINNELRGNLTKRADKAQSTLNGGIDLTPANMNLGIQNSNGEIKFHLDPAMLAQLQSDPGFVPVIISVQPMRDLRGFLEGASLK